MIRFEMRLIASLQDGLFEQIQLVFGEIQFRRHFVFVGRDESFNIFLNQFDGCRSPGLAVVAQRTVLSRRQFEGDRMIMVVATLAFFVLLSHNTLI